MPRVSGAWCALPQETSEERNLGCRTGQQFYRKHKVSEETVVPTACRKKKWLDQGRGGQWLCLGQAWCCK